VHVEHDGAVFVMVQDLAVEPPDHARLPSAYFSSLRTTMKYVIASARASAASAGLGISGGRTVAPPLPDLDLLAAP